MKDGEGCSIRLEETRLEGTLTLYSLHLQQGRATYRLAARYSKLRSIAALLPKTEHKFPPPHHVTRLLSSLTGDTTFLAERREGMTRYFQAVSCQQGLSQNEGFRTLLAMAQLEPLSEPTLPSAPKPTGRKLARKQLEGELLVIAS